MGGFKMSNPGESYKPIWPFPEDSSIECVTYKRLLSLSERATHIAGEAEALRKEILLWMYIDSKERENGR
jgi:hypothetical protein